MTVPFTSSPCMHQHLNHRSRIAGNTRPQLSTLLPHRSINCTALHFALGVDNHSRIIFKVEIYSVYGQLCPRVMGAAPLRRQVFLWRTTTAGMTFFRSSGFPFLTVAITMSPTPSISSVPNIQSFKLEDRGF